MGISYEALDKIRRSKIDDLLKRNLGSTATNPRMIGSVTTESNEDFNFVMFDSTADGFTKGMKRYNFAAYSSLFFETYYVSSNVIDADKGYTMQDFKQHFNNYLRSLHTSLQQYL